MDTQQAGMANTTNSQLAYNCCRGPKIKASSELDGKLEQQANGCEKQEQQTWAKAITIIIREGKW